MFTILLGKTLFYLMLESFMALFVLSVSVLMILYIEIIETIWYYFAQTP